MVFLEFDWNISIARRGLRLSLHYIWSPSSSTAAQWETSLGLFKQDSSFQVSDVTQSKLSEILLWAKEQVH